MTHHPPQTLYPQTSWFVFVFGFFWGVSFLGLWLHPCCVILFLLFFFLFLSSVSFFLSLSDKWFRRHLMRLMQQRNHRLYYPRGFPGWYLWASISVIISLELHTKCGPFCSKMVLSWFDHFWDSITLRKYTKCSFIEYSKQGCIIKDAEVLVGWIRTVKWRTQWLSLTSLPVARIGASD